MDGFTRRKEQSKEDIRKAAGELFSQFGVEKVSIADIARKAGVSPATIYNNFGSKEALAREFVASAINQLVNGAQAVISLDIPYWEKMAAFFQFIANMMAQEEFSEEAGMAFSVRGDLLNDPEIKNIHVSAQEKMTQLLLGFIREGKDQGQIPSDLSDDALRIYFKAFMEMFPDPQFRQAYRKYPGTLHALSSLMIYGLSGQNRSTPPSRENS